MKRTLWISLSVGVLLVALGSTGCVRPRPTPAPETAKGKATATATRAVNVVVPQPTQTTAPSPTPEQTPEGSPEAQASPTPADVVVVGEPTAQPQPTATTAGSVAAGAGEVAYQVRWGDTLSRIAQRYGTTITAIVERNPQIVDRNRVYAGTTLVIPTSSAGSSTGEGTGVARETGDYVVQWGDTLAAVARRFGTSISALMQANPWITNMNYIQAGRHLVIPVGGEYTAPQVHVVRAGETLWAIARRYNTTTWSIIVRNNLANPNLIYVGQRLIIP